MMGEMLPKANGARSRLVLLVVSLLLGVASLYGAFAGLVIGMTASDTLTSVVGAIIFFGTLVVMALIAWGLPTGRTSLLAAAAALLLTLLLIFVGLGEHDLIQTDLD